MKIAIISNLYPTSNSASYAFVHARVVAYREKGHTVQVWAECQPELPIRSELDGVNISRLSAEDSISEVEEFAPDILVAHAPFKWSIQVARAIQCPKVVWIHGWESLLGWPYHYYVGWKQQIIENLADFFKLFRLRKFLPCCSAVVYVSHWMKRISQRFTVYKPVYTFVIPNPVDTDLFTPTSSSDLCPRQGLSVRGLEVNKYGLDVAIRAYAHIDGTDLTVIGTGRLAPWFESLIKRTGSRTRLIQQYYRHERLPSVYRNYKYFVAPSRTESHGISMCEAMACGLPVVGSRVGAIPEFVGDGEEGFLVPPGNVKHLRRAVLRVASLTEEEYRRLSENARRKVLATCAKQDIIDRELTVLAQFAST